MEVDRLYHTVYTLETAARWGIDVVAVRAEELHGVQSGQIGASTRHDVATVAVDSGAGAKDTRFVLVDLVTDGR